MTQSVFERYVSLFFFYPEPDLRLISTVC